MTSRRELYAHGEPFGDGATRRKLGGGYVCGFGGDSESATSNTTINYDNRVAVSNGIGLSNSNNNTITVTDGGIVDRALDTVDRSLTTVDRTVDRALDTADLSLLTSVSNFEAALKSVNAQQEHARAQVMFATDTAVSAVKDTSSDALSKALGMVDTTMSEGFNKLLAISEKLIGQTQQSVSSAWDTAQNTQKGTIDNKTIIVLGLAAAGVVVAVLVMKRGK